MLGKPAEFINLLRQHAISLAVDVRLRPDHASMGCYKKAEDPSVRASRVCWVSMESHIYIFKS